MSQRSESSLQDIWNGLDGIAVAIMMRVGLIVIGALMLAGVFQMIHV